MISSKFQSSPSSPSSQIQSNNISTPNIISSLDSNLQLWENKIYWFESQENLTSPHSIYLKRNNDLNATQLANESFSNSQLNSTIFNIPFFEKSVTNVFLYAKQNIFKALFPERFILFYFSFLFYLIFIKIYIIL